MFNTPMLSQLRVKLSKMVSSQVLREDRMVEKQVQKLKNTKMKNSKTQVFHWLHLVRARVIISAAVYQAC